MTTERDAAPPPLLQPGFTPNQPEPSSMMIEKIRAIHVAGTEGEHRRHISQIFVYREITPDGQPVPITRKYLESLMRFGQLPYIDIGFYSESDARLDERMTTLYRATAIQIGQTEALLLMQDLVAGIAGIALYPSTILEPKEVAYAPV